MTSGIPAVKLSSGFQMPVLGLGTFNKFRPLEVYDAVKAAIDTGYRHIDAAWVYQSEKEIGDAIKEKIGDGTIKREDLFITSKLWSTFHAPDRVEAGLTESLDDLGLTYMDLFLMHWPMAFQEPVDRKAWIMNTDFKPADVDFIDTWRAMEKLVDKCLVRSIGVSNFNIGQLKRLLGADNLKYKPANIQIEVSPYFTNTELLNFCQEEDIPVTAYSPLAKGGGEYAGRITPSITEEEVLKKIALKYGKTAAQVALRWGLQRNYMIVPKSVTPSRIKENFYLFDFELTDEEISSVTSLNRNQRLVTLENFKDFPEYPFK